MNSSTQFELTKKAFLSSFSNGSSLILVCHLGCGDWFGLWLFGFSPPTWGPANLCFGLPFFSLRFFFWLFGGRPLYGWHFIARSLCLNTDVLLQKLSDAWLQLEWDLAWQMFLTCTWKHLPALLLFTEFEPRFAWFPWTKGKSVSLLKWWDKGTWYPHLNKTGGWSMTREKTVRDNREQQMASGEELSGMWPSHTGQMGKQMEGDFEEES